MFTKSSRIENLRSEVVGNRWNTSETVGMYGNSRIIGINTKRHLKKGYPFVFLIELKIDREFAFASAQK